MTRAASEILKEALTLTAEERAELADNLLESLDMENDPGLEEAWDREIRRRIAELDSGKASTTTWSEVKAQLMADLSDES